MIGKPRVEVGMGTKAAGTGGRSCPRDKTQHHWGVVDTYNGILLSHKEGNPTVCDNTDGPGDMKLATEGQILCDPS